MTAKSLPPKSDFKKRCKEVLLCAKQTISVSDDYFTAEEKAHLDRLIVLNNENNFKNSIAEIKKIDSDFHFLVAEEENRIEKILQEIKNKPKSERRGNPELNTAIIRDLSFHAIIYATDFMVSKHANESGPTIEYSEELLTKAYILLREVEQIR